MHELSTMIQIGLSAGLILFAVAFMHRRTRNDRYREDLFTIRDELFDHMWQNGIPFDLPAYRLLRTFLNGAIRTADLPGLAFVVLLLLWKDRLPSDPLTKALGQVEDEAVKQHLREVSQRAVSRVHRHMFRGISRVVFHLVVAVSRIQRSSFGAEAREAGLMVEAGSNRPHALALVGRAR